MIKWYISKIHFWYLCAVKRHLVKGTIWIIWLTSSQQLWISLSPFSAIWIWWADIILKDRKCSMMIRQIQQKAKVWSAHLDFISPFFSTYLGIWLADIFWEGLKTTTIKWYIEDSRLPLVVWKDQIFNLYHSFSSHGLVGDAASFDSRTTSWKLTENYLLWFKEYGADKYHPKKTMMVTWDMCSRSCCKWRFLVRVSSSIAWEKTSLLRLTIKTGPMLKKDKQQKREEINIKISSHLHRGDLLNMLLVLFVHQPIQLLFHLGGVDLQGFYIAPSCHPPPPF